MLVGRRAWIDYGDQRLEPAPACGKAAQYDRAVQIVQLLPHTAAVDGIQRAALDLTRGLKTAGDRSYVMAMERGDNVRAWEEAAEAVLTAPSLSATWREPRALAQGLRRSRALVDDIDVIVAHRLDLLTAGAALSFRTGASLVLHAHNAPPHWLRWGDVMRVPGSRRVQRVIVASRYMETVWRPVLGPDVPIHVVEYPIDPDFFAIPSGAERQAAKSWLGLREDEATVGFFGRLEPIKGLHVLAEAIGILADAPGREPRLIVQGPATPGIDPQQTDDYRRRCVDLLGAPGTWLPANPDTRKAMAACDVVAVPSVWAEPSGLVVSEALCCGVPVAVSSVGGIPEQIPAASAWARTVAADDARALAHALGDLLARAPTDEERRSLRRHITERRAPAAIVDAYRHALLAR